MRSPGWAPFLSSIWFLGTSPMAVPQRMRSSCSFVSPPMMLVLNLSAQSFIPSTICSRNSIGWPLVIPMAVTTPNGLPPIAAMSLRLTATIDHPMS